MPFPLAGRNLTLYFLSFKVVRQNPDEVQGEGSLRCYNHSTLVANSIMVFLASPVFGWATFPAASVWQAPKFASRGSLHPLEDVTRLAAWHTPGMTSSSRSEEFLKGQPAMCSDRGVYEQKSSIRRLGNVFVVGVIGNREILLKQNQGQFVIFLQNNLRTFF